MTGLFLPGAAWRPVSYRGDSGLFAAGQPVGYIPHVQQGNGGLWSLFEHAPAGDRKFSNAWIAKDGYSEQYAEANRKPWAQADGNSNYRAYECEGFGNEPYTAAQINTLATWHNFTGDSDVLANAPLQRGVGTHNMGGAAYGGHSCPDPIRQAQRSEIIARAIALRGGVILPPVPHPPKPTGKIILGVDGVFGPQSRMRLQQWAGVQMDSVLGPISWRAIQRKFGGLVADGAPGKLTWTRIQKVVGLKGRAVDGTPGPVTYRALQNYLNTH